MFTEPQSFAALDSVIVYTSPSQSSISSASCKSSIILSYNLSRQFKIGNTRDNTSVSGLRKSFNTFEKLRAYYGINNTDILDWGWIWTILLSHFFKINNPFDFLNEKSLKVNFILRLTFRSCQNRVKSPFHFLLR